MNTPHHSPSISCTGALSFTPVGQYTPVSATTIDGRRDHLPNLPIGSILVYKTPKSHW